MERKSQSELMMYCVMRRRDWCEESFSVGQVLGTMRKWTGVLGSVMMVPPHLCWISYIQQQRYST